MGNKKEEFVALVLKTVQDLKVPLINSAVSRSIDVIESKYPMQILFEYENEDSTIKGFLGLADYFRSVVIQIKDVFYIAKDSIIFKLTLK